MRSFLALIDIAQLCVETNRYIDKVLLYPSYNRNVSSLQVRHACTAKGADITIFYKGNGTLNPIFSVMKGQKHMANAVKEAVAEKIEVVDQLEETGEKKGIKLWFLAIPAVLILAAGAFLWARQFFGSEEV